MRCNFSSNEDSAFECRVCGAAELVVLGPGSGVVESSVDQRGMQEPDLGPPGLLGLLFGRAPGLGQIGWARTILSAASVALFVLLLAVRPHDAHSTELYVVSAGGGSVVLATLLKAVARWTNGRRRKLRASEAPVTRVD
jgi:hypothetical protein